jgi:glycerophosphoryl diester phosphodiesterase
LVDKSGISQLGGAEGGQDFVLNIAHRGASGSCPENTITAFRAAIEAGADMCELDVRLTRDGAVVVIHDDTVDRTTDGTGAIAAMTLAEIKRLDAGAKFDKRYMRETVPTLDEVFELVNGRCSLNIELKSDGLEAKVSELVRSRDAFRWTLVSSFDWAALARIRHIAPELRVGLLASRWPARLVGAATEMKADAINPSFDIITEDLCIAAHSRELNVYAWTVDEPAAMRRLIAAGVDGIMTNRPERLREVIGG